MTILKRLFPKSLKLKILDYFSEHPYIVQKFDRKEQDKSAKYYGLMADEALIKLIRDYDFETVLDIGSGEGRHAQLFIESGKKVTALDYGESIYFKKAEDDKIAVTCDYMKYEPQEKFDCIWLSHVLEHQPNPNLFLKKIRSDTKTGGLVAISVPPLKHDIVGGHINLYNAGLLLYQMVLAGFDCREASIHTYGYNISIIVRASDDLDLSGLTYDSGDIQYLSQYFPKQIRDAIGETDCFDGRIYNVNW
ncbi:class I SAM-dependent methyltransferase [Grimontia marina]|uniref:Ubiquinone biosynthesis O-methyltransferase n=1 Tax=Grimontia marina TaxID=646534 RepID=A0A128ERR7_9GAMM|nr:class I SAM-dependent methyltransferase [Grimontia marina]CZF77338.1 Ubiquinone biosynthesis O-methyltransferase [Grimontia marina]